MRSAPPSASRCCPPWPPRPAASPPLPASPPASPEDSSQPPPSQRFSPSSPLSGCRRALSPKGPRCTCTEHDRSGGPPPRARRARGGLLTLRHTLTASLGDTEDVGVMKAVLVAV